jgi:hypothetical protein
MIGEKNCDCGICSFCNGMSPKYDLSSDESGAMLVEVVDSGKDNIINSLISALPKDAMEEIIILNRLREESGLIKIAAKHEAKNKKLWAKCIAEAKRKFDVFPSAYANGFASRLYKKKGGTWKTVKPKSRKK